MSSQQLCVPITLAAIELVDALFSAAIGTSILSDGFSAHLRREVLWLSGGYAIDVWIGFNEWKYLVPEGRFEIGKSQFETKTYRLRDKIMRFIW